VGGPVGWLDICNCETRWGGDVAKKNDTPSHKRKENERVLTPGSPNEQSHEHIGRGPYQENIGQYPTPTETCTRTPTGWRGGRRLHVERLKKKLRPWVGYETKITERPVTGSPQFCTQEGRKICIKGKGQEGEVPREGISSRKENPASETKPEREPKGQFLKHTPPGGKVLSSKEKTKKPLLDRRHHSIGWRRKGGKRQTPGASLGGKMGRGKRVTF